MRSVVAAALVLVVGSAVAAEPPRIKPICDDTRTPRCWVPHADVAPRLAPEPPVAAQPSAPIERAAEPPVNWSGMAMPPVRFRIDGVWIIRPRPY